MSIEKWKGGNKRAVFFDLNGTLIDPGRSFEEAFVSVLEDVAGRWAADYPQLVRDSLQVYRKEQERLSKRTGTGGRQKDRVRYACLEKALGNLPVSITPVLIRKLDRTIREKRELHPRLYPGTIKALTEIASGRQVALISNGGRERLLRRVSRSGLGSFFPAERIFTSATGRRGKPHPEVFRQAMQALGVHPGEALLVGDSRTKDVAGALGVGMDVCWFRPGSGKAAAAHKKPQGWLLEASSLEQVATLLR